MSIPKEPRQIMINLMYLVLTAMLALNVSSEILHAFKTINQSILASNASIVQKNSELYQDFDDNEKLPGQAERVHPYNMRAKQVKADAEAMISYLESWKNRIIEESGGREEDSSIKREDNIDASTRLLVEMNGGDSLKTKLLDLREKMLGQLDDKDSKNALSKQLPLKVNDVEKTDNNTRGDWVIGTFYNMPTMAAITLFSKFQNDVRNSEALIINELFREASSKRVTFDNFKAIAVPKNSYVLAGQKVEAEVMLAAYNTSLQPSVSTNMGHVTPAQEGVAHWENVASGVGLQTVRGNVSINMNGQDISKPYEFQYMVGSEGASMQLDKMNVFYIGVDNPVTVSAAGYSLEDVSINFPDGEVKPSPDGKGHYLIRSSKPSGPDGVKVGINAKTQGGAVKEVGAMKVRVKYIPDPVAVVGKKAGGYMPAAQFRPQVGVEALLLNFEFDARYVVTEFSYSVMKKRDPDLKGPYKQAGPVWDKNADIMRLQRELKAGDRVFIDDIKAKGPDGRVRPLNPLSFTLT